MDGEGVCCVEDLGGFGVDGAAGFEEACFAVGFFDVGFVFVGVGVVVVVFVGGDDDGAVVFRVVVIAAAAICGPFATIVRDARLVPWTVEVDDFVAKDVDVDHAADFVREICEKVAALGLLWLAGTGQREVPKLLGSFGKGPWNCSFGVKLSPMQYDWAHD